MMRERAALSHSIVKVVRIDLDQAQCPDDVLDEYEQARAARFVRDRDQRRFRVAHAALRHILALHLDMAPERIRFSAGAKGKPSVANALDLRFNLSHAGERALVALAVGREVGVDIEEVRDLDVLGLVQVVCSPAERELIAAASDSCRLQLFYSCWTRKESYVKALGDGLSFPVWDLDLQLDVDDLQRRTASRRKSNDTDRWTIRPLPMGPDYVAALTVEGNSFAIMSTEFVMPSAPTAGLTSIKNAADTGQ